MNQYNTGFLHNEADLSLNVEMTRKGGHTEY